MVAMATQADQTLSQNGNAAPGKLSAAATYLQSSIFSDTLRKGVYSCFIKWQTRFVSCIDLWSYQQVLVTAMAVSVQACSTIPSAHSHADLWLAYAWHAWRDHCSAACSGGLCVPAFVWHVSQSFCMSGRAPCLCSSECYILWQHSFCCCIPGLVKSSRLPATPALKHWMRVTAVNPGCHCNLLVPLQRGRKRHAAVSKRPPPCPRRHKTLVQINIPTL